MDELFLYSKKLVKNKIKSELSSNVEDLLSIAIYGILLYNPEIEKNKLSKILEKLIIYEDLDKYDLVKMRLHNHYIYDENIKKFGTTVVSSYTINSIKENDITYLDDKKVLFIFDLPKMTISKLVSNIIHSLLHLLRFDGFTLNNNKIIRKDGLCYTIYDLNNKLLEQKYFNIEEGIIEKYVQDIMILLRDTCLSVYSKQNSILQNFKKELACYDFYSWAYDIQKDVVNTLCLDSNFNSLLYNSFVQNDITAKIESYFNEVMGHYIYFNMLSDNLDILVNNDSIPIKLNAKYEILDILKKFNSLKCNIQKKKNKNLFQI